MKDNSEHYNNMANSAKRRLLEIDYLENNSYLDINNT